MDLQSNVIIDADDLFKIRENPDLVLIDARFSKTAKEDYLKAHLEYALYVNLNEDLSDIKENAANGGRHPLPAIRQFSKLLTKLGITPDSHVVIYDANTGAMAAARFWWMLKSAGHKHVQVLNGGLKEAIKAGYPLSSKLEKPNIVNPYKVTGWQLPMATMSDVEEIAKSRDHLVIDVRAEERYLGKEEPIDLIAGHIPGAINVPFATHLDGQGSFLSPEALKEKYSTVLGETRIENVVVHCGSGVTACHTLLAFAQAGYPVPKLYVGSWSEWSRNDKPVATQN